MIPSGTWFFAFWYVLGAVFLVAALAVWRGWWEVLPVVGRRAVGVVAGVLVAGFLVTQACIFSEFNDEGEPGLDYIVVLGAQVHENGPSVVLRYRLDAARDYLEANPETVCIVSGGQGLNEHTAEANVMADYLSEQGIDEQRIIREDCSTNTLENIEFSGAFLDSASDTVGIVTNNFHVFRSVQIARKVGYAHVCGLAAPSSLNTLPNNLARESLGIAKDFAVGNL